MYFDTKKLLLILFVARVYLNDTQGKRKIRTRFLRFVFPVPERYELYFLRRKIKRSSKN